MAKWLISILVLLCLGLRLPAQQDWSWVFGDSVLMRFPNGGPPEVDSSTRTRYSFENISCIADSIGELLLYANQDTIYSGQSLALDQGKIWTWGEISNGISIFPIWKSPERFFVFYLSVNCTTAACPEYAIVHTSATTDSIEGKINLGQYDIANPPSEKVSTVRDANGSGWWVLLHGGYDNQFLKYHIVGDKVLPRIQQGIGNIHTYIGQNPYFPIGEMSFSPDGTKLLAVTMTGIVDVFDFDRCSGDLSNCISLGTPALTQPGPDTYYGCSFSPDGTKIYVSEGDEAPTTNHLYQWDLTATNIAASKTVIFTAPDSVLIGQHQLGPDGKIYITQIQQYDSSNGANFSLSVINDPNQAGLACNFSYLSLPLKGRRTTGSLPNLPNFNLPPLVRQVAEAGPQRPPICPHDSIRIGYPDSTNGAVTYHWSPTTGIADSTAAYTWAAPDTTTWYYLTAFDTAMGMPCGLTIDSVLVRVANPSDLPMVSLGNDTIVCTADSVSLGGSATPGWRYLWNTGDTTAQIWAAQAATYSVTVTNPASGLHCYVSSDSIKVLNFPALQPLTAQFAGVDAVICLGDSALIGTTQISGWHYLWSPSNTLSSPTIAQPVAAPVGSQDYALLATDSASSGRCAQAIDSVYIMVEQPFTHAAPEDVSFCVGECFTLGVEPVRGMQYAWTPTTGLTSPSMSMTKAQPTVTMIYNLNIINPALQSANCREKNFTVLALADACNYPSFISVNGDGIAERLILGDHAGRVELQVYDMAGRLVFRDDDYHNTWSASNLANGLYVYRVTVVGDCPSAFTGKIVVVK